MDLIFRIMKFPSNSYLYPVLLCLWGVTPSHDYLSSITTILSQLIELYASSPTCQFYDIAFQMEHIEGLPAFHIVLLLILLFLCEEQDISLQSTSFPFSRVLTKEQICYIQSYLALIEVRRECFLSHFVFFYWSDELGFSQ